MEKLNFTKEVDKIVESLGTTPDKVIPILHAVQKEFNYLPEPALKRITEITEISTGQISGVSTFYSQFRHEKVGKHIIQVCIGTACHIKGAESVYKSFRQKLEIPPGKDTDNDGLFTLVKVSCLGCCTIAPVVQIDDLTFGKVGSEKVSEVLEEFIALKASKERSKHKKTKLSKITGEIKIGLGSCCVANGSGKVNNALKSAFNDLGIMAKIKPVGCVGMCHRTPLLEISSDDQTSILYEKVQAGDVKKILLNHFQPDSFYQLFKNKTYKFIEQLFLKDEPGSKSKSPINPRDQHINNFLGKQVHIATEHCGKIDPLDFKEYCTKGGFEGLKTVLDQKSPLKIIETIDKSRIRGRGGAGFPTSKKLQLAYKAEGKEKYIICNGDEGDPGAFMDRMILESYPFRVIEGMCILAYAIGASKGFFYIRSEYPLAVERISLALEICKKNGLLGDLIQGSDFSLNIKIVEGAGAFVCGEETALLASLEGKRGNPTYRPPYPVIKGLYDSPTLVNNCETMATIPWIIRNGDKAFTLLGTAESKGTKVFSLAGKVARGGLIEVPMGITIKEIVEDIGGGCENDGQFKAIQIGGPSGGCIPANLKNIKIDFEELSKIGAMMGSGGLLVMNQDDCMVEIARYFLSFTCNQSCGKCTFCRIGTRMMLDILEDLCAGNGKLSDLEKLEDLAEKTKIGSLCGLGKTAPNPVLTTLKYFREEYEAHIEGKCPAKFCKDLITYSINDQCIGCTICSQNCPDKAIEFTPYRKHKIDIDKCTRCGICKKVCPNFAVEVE